MSPIYLMFDVDCDIKQLDHEPTAHEVVGWFDGRFIKIDTDGKVYASFFYDDNGDAGYEWKPVEFARNN